MQEEEAMISMKHVACGGHSNRPERGADRRLLAGSILGIVAALAVGLTDPAHAAKDAAGAGKIDRVNKIDGMNRVGRIDDSAEQLRRLDIMLMVTSLRCRKTVDDFQADYGDFTQEHLSELNDAARSLQAGFVGR